MRLTFDPVYSPAGIYEPKFWSVSPQALILHNESQKRAFNLQICRVRSIVGELAAELALVVVCNMTELVQVSVVVVPRIIDRASASQCTGSSVHHRQSWPLGITPIVVCIIVRTGRKSVHW
ncbi:hypothetical protein J6590_045433 [Homalodisca vitripennis]|nr:hypothetical protein J6590_045433 [Homalodisca vitripennis]